MKNKELFYSFASVVFSVFLALATLEIIFDFNPELLPPNVRFSAVTNFNSELRQFFKPNVDIRMNLQDGNVFRIKTVNLGTEIGFRDDGLNHDEIYAVVLGDSFVYGHGLELKDVWTEKLEKRLNKDVINMGMPSAYPETEYKIFEKYGRNFKSKIVILGVFQNDFADAYVFNYLEKNFGYNYLKRTLDSSSSVYRLFRFAIAMKSFSAYKNYPTFTMENTSYIVDPFLAGPVVDKNKMEINLGSNITKNYILELKKLVENDDSEFLLIIFPSKEQVFWDIVKEKTDKNYEIDFLNNELAKLAEENDIQYIDLTKEFRNVSKFESNLFFQIDGHMNENGNRIAEEIIYKYLVENNLLD